MLNFSWRWALAIFLVMGLVIAGLCWGPYPTTPLDVFKVILSRFLGITPQTTAILDVAIWEVRLPRVMAALAVGAALAVAGTAFQSLFRNPLVSPDILGVSSGAGLGAVAGIFLSLPLPMVQGLSFLGGLLAVGLVYGIASALKRQDPMLILVLAGIAVGSFLGAAISLMKVLADPYDKLPAITFWLLGSLASLNREEMAFALPVIALGIVVILLLRWRINLMSLGEEEARALGIEPSLLRPLIIAAATMATAAAVSLSGIIGWIGLIVPHLARIMVGPDLRRLLPASILLGGGYLVFVDLIARNLGTVEIPLGILTATMGAPLFLYLLAAQRRGWS